MDQAPGSAENGAAGRIADDMKGKLGDIAADAARTAVASNLDRAAAAVEDRYGAVLDPTAETIDRVTNFVRVRPFIAVLLAGVAGFAIGKAA